MNKNYLFSIGSVLNLICIQYIKADDRTIRSEIHKLVKSIGSKEELPEDWNESIIVPIYKKNDEKDCSNYRGQLRTKFYPISVCQG